MSDDCWTVLDIAATRDEREIRRAYARQLKRFRPDEDPVGFQRLVEARDEALLLATLSESVDFSEETTASLPEKDFDDIVVVASSSVQGDSAAADTDAAPQNQSDAQHRSVLRAVYETLNGLIDNIKTNNYYSLKTWKAENWSALFNQAALLGMDEHRAFQQTIARRLVEFLPDPDEYHPDDLANFEAGNGPCAVVEQIENECQFTWFGLGFAQIAGQRAADRYFSWLARAQTARALIERRQNPDTAYSNPVNGLPLFLPEDRIVLFRDAPLNNFFEKAEEQGSWPFQLDIKSLFTPGSRLADAGFRKAGFAVAAVICGLSASLNTLHVDWVLIALLCLCVSVACRVCLSATHYKRTVQHYTRYVKDVDKRGVIYSPGGRRNYLAERRKRPALSGHLWVLEVAATVMLVFPLMTFATSWRHSDLMDQPVATVLADQFVSLFEIAAGNDAVETTSFVSLAASMNKAALLLENDRSTESTLLRDVSRPLDIVRFRSQLTELSERTTKSVKPLTPLIARQRKLEKLAELYRQASVEERRAIEKTLAQWGRLLEEAALFDPLYEAALWELLPPRTSEARSLVSPERELRRVLVKQFLNGNIASIASFEKQNIAQKAAQLELLLNASDSLLLALVNASVITKEETFTGVESALNEFPRQKHGDEAVSGPRFLDGMIYNVIGSTDRSDDAPRLAVFNEALPVWSEEIIGWEGFLKYAVRCLNTVAPDDRNVARTRISEVLKTARNVNEQDKSRYWTRASNRMFDIPACRVPYAPVAHRATTREGLQAQISNLSAERNSGEARTAAHYALAIAEEGYWGGELRSFANSYLAYDSLQKGLPQQALYYLDGATDRYNLCRQIRALRGATLEALGEKERALREFQASRRTYGCSSTESGFSYDDADIDNRIEKLATETEAPRPL
nr:J domain-containing protein [Brucella intermedia]